MNQTGVRVEGGVCAPLGFEAHAVECGVKDPKNPRLDMAMIYSDRQTTSAAVFTTNQVRAAAVKVCEDHAATGTLRAILVNSGNANACTGSEGIQHALASCKALATSLGLGHQEVGVCSTGVIGLPLPIDRMLACIPALAEGRKRSNEQGDLVSQAIMTSDTRPKQIALELTLQGKAVRIGASAKGAGMIKPSMATMLSFITTDLEVPKQATLQEMLRRVTDDSFNKISIDGDMSTNDTAILLANGASGVSFDTLAEEEKIEFEQAVLYIMDYLARAIVLDGEKVTKFITLKVVNAQSREDAKAVAEAVSNSPLVKSAWNGDDPNWGRVIHAVGYAPAFVREDEISIYWGDQPACVAGKLGPASIAKLREEASKSAFDLTINLNIGDGNYEMYTSDISPEYVDYNRSEYSYWKAVERNQG